VQSFIWNDRSLPRHTCRVGVQSSHFSSVNNFLRISEEGEICRTSRICSADDLTEQRQNGRKPSRVERSVETARSIREDLSYRVDHRVSLTIATRTIIHSLISRSVNGTINGTIIRVTRNSRNEPLSAARSARSFSFPLFADRYRRLPSW